MYFLFMNIAAGAPYAAYLMEVFSHFSEGQIYLDTEWTVVSKRKTVVQLHDNYFLAKESLWLKCILFT